MGIILNRFIRIVKFIIIAICVLFLIFLGISLVLPAKIKVERSISIRAKPKAVKYQILNFRNWPNWHPYLQTGEKIKISLSRNEKKMELTDNRGKKLAYQFVSELNDTIVFSHSDGSIISPGINLLLVMIRKLERFWYWPLKRTLDIIVGSGWRGYW
ncbi:hypothetical protein BH20BAC1_BH20BAC1_23910 [soil metagenome]